MNFIDRDKTLTELEERDWGPPTFDSQLVAMIHSLRYKPLGQFTIEELRICIGQYVGLKFLIPVAVEQLRADPLVEGGYYRGDLLAALLEIKPSFWSEHPGLHEMVAEIAEQAAARRQEIAAEEAKTLERALTTFWKPKFSPLQKVVVIEKWQPDPGEGGILGEHGIIIWRSSYFVRKSRYGAWGWLYVVHFPQSDSYDGIEESRLMETGETVSLESCLGREFEISYDRDGNGPDAIRGSFRVPGGFWNTFLFYIASVHDVTYEIKMPVRLHSQGIAKYEFAVPQGVRLDSQYIEEVMSKVLHANEWRLIRGLDSKWFS
jgi:hypothetical protein